jgi:hypothetical protein
MTSKNDSNRTNAKHGQPYGTDQPGSSAAGRAGKDRHEDKYTDGRTDKRTDKHTAANAPRELGVGAELDATPPDATRDRLPPDSQIPGRSTGLTGGPDRGRR